jgi:hypothetical protein
VLRPDDLKYEVKQAEARPAERAELIREIERKLTSDPYTRYRGEFENALATLGNAHGK